MKKQVFALLLIAFMAVILCGCDDSSADSSNVSTGAVSTGAVDYGNGVYYFPQDGSQFGNALSRFIEAHPSLELVAFADNGKGLYGKSIGHFVVFREK